MLKPVKLAPHYANYIWGGSVLETYYGKDGAGDIIAESWELSTHKDGGSKIADGENAGKTLEQYLIDLEKETGENPLGTKAKTKNGQLPILIKFIDARDDLSIQVHPGDEYAKINEGDNGKTEMWLILESEPGSYLYYGVSKKTTRSEIEEKIKTDDMETILRKVPVKKGEIYFIPAGTIHAIGKGIVICEIQQSSNVTYRLYDYGRTDKEGNKRPLHIKKGLDVATPEPQNLNTAPEQILDDSSVRQIALLRSCPYFTTYSYKLKNSTVDITGSKESFISIICIDGAGTIKAQSESFTIKKGETLFIPAGEQVYTVTGTNEFLTVTL
ncbi:MAG: class I mannose-6-phosphate isomerase [Oscillospiraceae bacterium]|nr:class I mannose-6-phosphate isomerase [Oscillospiraceae bacterium]MCL2278500.1 class I mannose-6-phosphate isomerase [Oscillospiraceae bacterium]